MGKEHSITEEKVAGLPSAFGGHGSGLWAFSMYKGKQPVTLNLTETHLKA